MSGHQKTTSFSVLVRRRLDEYVEQTGERPERLLINPNVYDQWRAELLVTGRLRPGGKFDCVRRHGVIVKIELDEETETCEVE